MLSVLVPVYNYNIVALVNEIHHQLQENNIPFEIICLDDCSNSVYTEKNSEITSLVNTSYIVSHKNNGRVKSRQMLCDQSTYDKLLFLDADTLPCHSNFIETYLKYIDKEPHAIFGGIAYKTDKPHEDYLLRWNYGKMNESRDAVYRNIHPYRTITSPNFLIKKSIFKYINSKIKGSEYGNDIYFASLMRKDQIEVLHINNEVFHLGLEKSADYLSKSEQALHNFLNLLRQSQITSKDNELLKTFVLLKKLKLNYIFSLLLNVFNNTMKKNLLGKNPSIKLFQLYRLSYLCKIDLIS